MWSLWILVLGCLASAAIGDPADTSYGSPYYLEQQEDVLLLLKYVHQDFWNPDMYSFSHFYNISSDFDSYGNTVQAQRFADLMNRGKFLKRNTYFTVDVPEHLKQTRIVFDVMFSAKNYETLAKVVVWSRFNLNEKMFMYVIGLLIAHRKDVREVIMMPPYEMCPYQFINSETIKEAQRMKMQGFLGVKEVDGLKTVVIPMNYTGWYKRMNPDQKLTYLTEDPTFNAFYYNFHLDYPHWLEGKPYGLDKDRRGELFLFHHHNLLSRYYLERLSNGLGEIPDFDWRETIESGYEPSLIFYNGQQHPGRPNHYNFYQQRDHDFIIEAEDHERRVRDVVDKGSFEYEGKTVSMSKPEDVNMLGNLIQGNPDGAEVHHNYHNYIVPFHIRNYPTALRDPIFYQFYKRLMKTYYRFMSLLTPYTAEEVGFSGVEITSVRVNKIETFFEDFEVDITNAIDVEQTQAVTPVEGVKKVSFKPDSYYIKARVSRLNHKPAKFMFKIQSDKLQTATVRIFLGPKYDEFGVEMDFTENHKNFLLIDTFTKELHAGENVIDHGLRQDWPSHGDQTSYYTLYKRLLLAKKGEVKWDSDLFKGRCKFPKNLIYPKGTTEGLTYQYFFIVNKHVPAAVPKFSTFDPKISCGVGSGSRYLEDRPMLFPIDRTIDPTYFYTPNMHFEDVEIHFNPELH